ncbi:MAG: CHAT domain-containing protein [Acidobacteria bacterium]|nr:CHAT domain-containing protein [Acidobacteriota bacterium]
MLKKSFQLLLQIAAALVISAAPVAGQTSAELPVLSAVKRELNGGETHSYRVQLTSGQFLHAVVEQDNIDLATAVFGPDGKQLSESDSPNDRWGFEPVIVLANAAGEYRVDVRSPNSRAPAGGYEIRTIALRSATATDRGHAAAQLAFDEARKLRQQQNPDSKRAAIEKYEQALPLFAKADDIYRRALTLHSIGLAYYALNEIRKALDYFRQTAALAGPAGYSRVEAGAETYIGGMLDILGDVGKALDHHQRALKLARAGGYRQAEGSSLSNIGKIYNDAADWQKALEFYRQALPVFQALGSKPNEALTLNNIGIAYLELGEQERALDYLQQSLALMRAGTDKNAEAYTLLNIGRVHRRMGQYEKARSFYSEAQAIQKQTGNRAQEGETLGEMGVAYSAEGQHEKAVEYHRQALEIQRATGNLRREALTLTNLGEAYNLLDQPEKALEQFTTALAILRNIGDLNNAANALDGIARAEKKRGNLQAARKHIEDALALSETVRARSSSLQMRASYRASVEKAYELYIDVLMQQHAQNPAGGHDAEALSAYERGRARSLVEQLSEARVDIRRDVDPQLIKKEHDLSRDLNAKAQREMQLKLRKANNDDLAAIKREMNALEDEYQQVQASIRKTSPQYAALTRPRPLGLKEIQQELDAGTLLLEYSLGEERSYLWAVTPDSLKTYVLPKRAEIQKVAQKVYETLIARSVTKLETPARRKARIAGADVEFQQTATELSRMIIEPAASELGNKRLVIVAEGALQYVPFGALSMPAVAYQPLIVRHEVISLPSASAFAVQRENLANREPAPKTLAVIADPVFSVGDPRVKAGAESAPQVATRSLEHGPAGTAPGAQLSIPRLPFTRWEADQILAVARAGSNLKALDFRANRAIATSGELSKYRYVHFATHGYLDTARSGLSAIVLSLYDENGKPQDGFLRAHDIYNLKLPAELVVLSACETGLGKDVRGEGLEGLTRGFMYAGARRVVVSLWNVNDKATATLMQRLYAGMLRTNKTPAAALRAAQIEMLRSGQWQAPYYWAAFVMQGEWK